MRPPHRKGLLGTIPANPDIAHYAVYLVADKLMYVGFCHEHDKYLEHRPLIVNSIERKEYPNPHIIRGILEYDLNRPGTDADDSTTQTEVVIELWNYPETLVYGAATYVKKTWKILEHLPIGAIYKDVEDIKDEFYLKIDDHHCRPVKLDSKSWLVEGQRKKFNNYDMIEVIHIP